MRKTVLLIEDNPDDLLLTSMAIRDGVSNSDVVVARDGLEGLCRLFEPAEGNEQLLHPDLVLLDLKLPKVNGLEVLTRIKRDERTSSIPVVLLSSSDEQRDIEACYMAGASSYVTKPVDYEEFQDAVKQVANYWLSFNRASKP